MQQGILAAGEQRKPGNNHGAVISGRKKAGQGYTVLRNGKGVKARRGPVTGLKCGNIGLAYAPQCAQQGGSRVGNFLLHMGKIHSRHALAQHFFQQV